jgi:MoxR-like ATPase
MTPELGALLGYILGDGWINNYRVGMTVNAHESDIIGDLVNYTKCCFNVKPRISKRIKPKRQVPLYELTINSVDIASNLLKIMGEKRVPDVIFESGNAVVQPFLKWLFQADGTVFNKGRGKRAVQLKSKNIELLRDVQLLLLRFGIQSRICGYNLAIRRGRSIVKFYENIGFASKNKQEILKELADWNKNYHHPKHFLQHRRRFERITQINMLPPTTVYDIEVPGVHRFVANGIISHNTAKTQLLKFVQSVAPRGIYCSGRGSSGVGLTAAVMRDPDTNEMTLEAGALVLADRGVVAIDEIEKMRPEDRVNIHEPLESQTISIAKGGIVATLNARTAVLAAANPVFGRYNIYKSVFENLATLPSTLLSRFDLIFLMLDRPDPERDKKMADHILNLHRGTVQPPPIPRELLRKYIAYARQINPIMTKEAIELLSNFYMKVREKTEKVETLTEIGARQLEALVRIAEARARAALRKEVLPEDAEAAILITSKSLKQIGVDIETGEVDMDMIMTGYPKGMREKLSVITSVVIELGKEMGLVDKQTLLKTLEEEYKIEKGEAMRLIAQLIREGTIFEPKEGFYQKT